MSLKKTLLSACLLFYLAPSFAQKLYIAENGATEMRRSNVDGTNKELMSGGASNVLALKSMVFDEQRNTVFWIESNTIIKKASLFTTAGITQLNTSITFANITGAIFQSLAINPLTRQLFVSSNGGVYKLNLDAAFTVTSLPTATIAPFNISNIDVDVVNSKIYFVRPITTTEIWIANLDGSGAANIVPNSSANDITVDPASGKFYYTVNIFFPTTEGQVIARDLTTGANPVPIVAGEPNSLRGLAVDPKNGFIFWANGAGGTAGTIGRAGLDGSGKINIFTGLNSPVDVALDLSSSVPPKLYWTEGNLQEIHRMNTDGSDFERYYFGSSPYPTGIAIDNNARYIYWADRNQSTIKRGLIGETDFENLPPEVVLNYTDMFPGISGIELDPNNTMIYFVDAGNNRIQRADYSNTFPITGNDLATIATPFGIDLDLINGKIYYTANDNAAINTGTLYRANLDGTGQEPLWSGSAPDPQRFIHDVKVDPFNGFVYWAWTESNGVATIYRANISNVGGTVVPLVNPTGGEVRGLEIDPLTNKLWWVCRGRIGLVPPSIMQADLDDGGNAAPLHQITFLPPNGNFILLDRGTISPLVLNATTADKNETNVSVSGNLTFTFDQSVAASTVNSSNIIVRGEQTGIISGTFSGGGSSTVTFDPTADFKVGEVVRVTLAPGIQSVNGGNLARSESYQFTTASSAAPETPPYFEEHIISSTADGTFGLFPADMDGDGDMDVVGTASGTNGISWFENDGNQNFTEHPVANTTSGPTGTYVTDLDSDGDLDILVASQGDARIIWLDNDGSQNFTEKDVNASAGTPTNVYAADLDGDGDVDVLSTSYAPSVGSSANARLNYYINDGNENFTQFNLPNVNGTGAYPVDVDKDGDIDIVGVAEVATLSAILKDKVAWYENDGSLNFTEHIVDATPPQRPEDTFATDMDGDGDIDILVAASINFIGWYENDGSQAFARHEIGAGESQPREIHAADVDGDGDMDVISAHELLDEVALWTNDGSQNFARQSVTTSADLVWDVYAADMDGDGDLDLLSASRFGNEVSWYENTVTPNSPPVLSSTSSSVDYTGNPVAINPLITVGDPDDIDLGSGSVQFSQSSFIKGEDQLIFNNQNGIFGNYDSNTGILSLSGTASLAEYQDALRSVEYQNSLSNPSTTDRSVEFRVSDGTNQSNILPTTLTVNVTVPETIEVFNGVSPNGDTFNPYFKIANIETVEPENKVSVYNRWGDKVFEVDNYDNNDPKRRFDGTSDKGKDLPSGVYFYKIEFASGAPEITGYLTLKR